MCTYKDEAMRGKKFAEGSNKNVLLGIEPQTLNSMYLGRMPFPTRLPTPTINSVVIAAFIITSVRCFISCVVFRVAGSI